MRFSRLNRRVGQVIRRYRLHYAVLTVLANIIAITLVALVFPDVSNLWVSIFVLFSGLSASLTSLADLLDES